MSRFVHAQMLRLGQFVRLILPKRIFRMDSGAIFVMVVILGFIVAVGSTSALDMGDIANGLMRGAAYIMLALANVCIALAIFFLRFFITLASYNNYIDVPVVKLGWAMVRDVANMFFVVALLIIAFATILGYEQYEWKRGMVKLVLMAILINFSNLIAQLVIDVAHVFTITFLNAISATAGGNLINMFDLDKITSMVADKSIGTTMEGANLSILAASFIALLFAVMAALAIGSYLIVMSIRVVVLWALIILSPLAFALYAVPKGEKYAQEWWSEFSKHVIVAPIMVFFLWLSFATLGSGDILMDIQSDPSVVPLKQGDQNISASLAEISTWERMANFLIAFVFLIVGLRKTQETGAEGSGIVAGAKNFTKKVATIASGYAAGRWLTGKGGDLGTDFLKKTGKNLAMPILGRANKQLQRVQRARDRVAARINKATAKPLKDRKGAADKAVGVAAKMFGGISSMLIQSGGRSDKKAGDWAKAIEMDKERTKENYSTSSTPGGQYKLDADVKLEQDKARGAAKKERKKLERSTQAADRAATYRGGKKGILNTLRYGDDQQFLRSMESQVDTESKVEKLKREGRIFTAQKKSEQLQKEGRFTESEAVVRSAQVANVEEIDDAIKGINYKEYGTTARKIVKRSQDGIAAAAGNPAEIARIEQQRTREMMSLVSAAGKQDEETFLDTFKDAYQELGFTEDITDSNRMAAFAAVMAGRDGSATGGNVTASDAVVQADMNKVKAQYSDDEYNIVMRNMRAATLNAAEDGAVAWAGIVDGAMNKSTYETEYNFGSGHDTSGAAPVDNRHTQSPGVDNYVAKRMDLRQIKRANGFCDLDQSGSITDISASGQAMLMKLLQSMNENQVSQIKASFWEGLSTAGNKVAFHASLAATGSGIDTGVEAKVKKNLGL